MWPSLTPAACRAAPTARLRSPGTSERSMSVAPGLVDAAAALGLAVGGDDALHELVANDVLAAEADEVDVLDPGEDVAELDLGDVPGDDELRSEPEPREEHLHLLGACVLGLVEDHERRVERATPHEGERSHLDRAPLEVGVDPLWVEHVVERVEERPQVGV